MMLLLPACVRGWLGGRPKAGRAAGALRRRTDKQLPQPHSATASASPTRLGGECERERERERSRARAVGEAIDRAMSGGQWDHARRLAAAAARLAPQHSHLRERLARLHLACGEPLRALAMIESDPNMPASMRLLRTACLMQHGRAAEAHDELRRWCRCPSAPLDARRLLAILDQAAGCAADAADALRANLAYLEDPRTLEQLIVLAMLRERTEQAATYAQRLAATRAPLALPAEMGLLLRSLGVPARRDTRAPADEQVATLAMELVVDEAAIAMLLDAQRRRPDPPVRALVLAAVERVLPDLAEPVAAVERAARLLIDTDRPAEARRWVERGLRLRPMSAPLRLLMTELDALDAAAGEDQAADAASTTAAADVVRRLQPPTGDDEHDSTGVAA